MIREGFLGHTAGNAKLADAVAEADAKCGMVFHSRMLGLCDLIVNTLIVTLVCFLGEFPSFERSQGTRHP